nr:unnamed protein product [Callosobruchus chinensis]
MDDNARSHRTRAVQQALDNGNIARLEWPAMSPDISPIEHVWDYVSKAIFNRNSPPRSAQERIVAATEEWDNIPQENGIPQGSTLSDTLFTIAVNDLVESIDDDQVGECLYVDDLTIFASGRRLEDIESKLQATIDKLVDVAD